MGLHLHIRIDASSEISTMWTVATWSFTIWKGCCDSWKSDAWVAAKLFLSCWCSAWACLPAAGWRHRKCSLKYGAVVPRTKTASVNRNRHQHSDEGSAHCPVSTPAVQQCIRKTECGQDLTFEVHRILWQLCDYALDGTQHAKFCSDQFRFFRSQNTWFCRAAGAIRFFWFFFRVLKFGYRLHPWTVFFYAKYTKKRRSK